LQRQAKLQARIAHIAKIKKEIDANPDQTEEILTRRDHEAAIYSQSGNH
jgi:hypothetical protein